MIQTLCPVTSLLNVGPNIFVLSFHSPEIASAVLPGQFVNVKTNDLFFPFLRRPFSVYNVNETNVEIIFNVVGAGTKILSEKRPGDLIDVLGPLGCAYRLEDKFDTALLVAGGLGVAPLPMLTSSLSPKKKTIKTFLGARTSNQIVQDHLQNIHVATDDGSMGFGGTVVELLRVHLQKQTMTNPKIFGCGPTPMLKSLSLLAHELKIPCEVSLESAMACGIGICQGCPVERVDTDKKYSLICKEGTVFDTETIRLV